MIFLKKLIQLGKITALPLLVGVIYFISKYQSQFIGLEHFDEGHRLFIAVNYLDGKLQYRDFLSIHPPGYFIYTAAIFKLFGITLVSHRIGELLLHSLAVSSAVYLSISNGNILYGLISGLMMLIFPTDLSFGCVPFIFISFIFILNFIKSNKYRYLLLSGFFCGLVAFFRIDFGLYTLLSLLLTIVYYKFISGKVSLVSIRSYFNLHKTQFTKESLLFILGVFLGILPLLIYSLKAGFIISWKSLIISSREMTGNMSLPFPPLLPKFWEYIHNLKSISFQEYFLQLTYSWIFYLPYIVCGIIIYDLYKRKDFLLKKFPQAFYLRVLVVTFTLLLGIYIGYRPDIEHTWPLYFFVFTLFPYSLGGLYHLVEKSRLIRIICLFFIFLITAVLWSYRFLELFLKYFFQFSLLIFIYLINQKSIKMPFKKIFLVVTTAVFFLNLLLLEYYRIYRSPDQYKNNKDMILFDTPRAGKIFVSKQKEGDYFNLVKYLITSNANNEPIFIGSTRHDIIFINDLLLYFLTGVRSPTKYWLYISGVQSTLPVQEIMVKELESSKPKYAVLWALASVSNEPNLSSKSSGVHLLDNYIREKYQLEKQFGYYLVMKRKENEK